MDSFLTGIVLASNNEEVLPLNTILTMENNVFKEKGIVDVFDYSLQGDPLKIKFL